MAFRKLIKDFNPRPLTGATAVMVAKAATINISIHAPSRGRLSAAAFWASASRISIHAPSRGRLPFPPYQIGVLLISIHAPSRGRQSYPDGHVGVSVHFNPRPLTGATRILSLPTQLVAISIHAPSRGRPSGKMLDNQLTVISIHAPSRGRLFAISSLSGSQNFNPRPLTGATRRRERQQVPR